MMFKNKLLYTFLLLAVLLATGSSCKKWFDLKPSDGIVNEDFWKTKEDVHAAVIGCYASLLGDPNGDDKPLSEIFFLWGELRADMITFSTATKAEDLEIMNMNTTTTNSIVDWRPVYRTINYCNIVIKNAPAVMALDQTLTQEALNGYVAEAKALRALLYFYLVRSFGDVPLKLVPTTKDVELVSLAKSPQSDVLQQIMTDLNDAEASILTTYGNQASDKGRITRYTVNAIQADVYLWMEKYNEAISACDKIINSKNFGLISGNTAWFNTVYYNGNSNESIFEFQFNKQKTNTFYTMFGSTKRFIAATAVMDQVYTTDNTSDVNKDIRADGASVRAADNTIWKYVGKDASNLRAADDSYAHWFVYRYADVLLMKAEALAQLKTADAGAQALDLIYTVRRRANALPGTDNAPGPTDYDAIARFVLDEQARESMYEGKRWYNLLRYAKRNNYENLDILLEMIANTVPLNMLNSAKAKLQDHNSHYFPIYQYELQTNKLLIQNPFYK